MYIVHNLIFVALLPKITDLSGDIFLRALQSYERLLTLGYQPVKPHQKCQYSMTPKLIVNFPTHNTLFDIYGESLFEASMIEKSSHDQGRAIAISIICKIIPKMAVPWRYLRKLFVHFLLLSSKRPQWWHLASATALYHMEPVLVSGHRGILSLVIPVWQQFFRFVPKSKTVKSPLQTVPLESLRMCCYRLLSLIIVTLMNMTAHWVQRSRLIWVFTTLKCLKHPIIKTSPTLLVSARPKRTQLFCLNGPPWHPFGFPSNWGFPFKHTVPLEFHFNCPFTDHQNFLDLFPFLVRKFEELLLKPPANWAASFVDTQITIVRILEQWSRLNVLPSADSTRICTSLIGLTTFHLYSKMNLPLYFGLIISIYETVFSWLSAPGSPFVCVSAFITALVKFMNQDAKAVNSANANKE